MRMSAATTPSTLPATRRDTPAAETHGAAGATPARGVNWLAVLGVMGAAYAVILPFFFRGNASGHDFQFHIASWMEVAQQWKQGILYPRWAEWSNYGFGEARFIFYPPLSWMLGAALGLVLPWKLAAGAYIWLVLVLAGASMYRLAREWDLAGDGSRAGATLAAVLYTANPYNLMLVYFRSDFAELLAGALLPLVVLYALRLGNGSSADANWRWSRFVRGDVIRLALVFAAIWLTNAPAAVVTTYSLALLVAVLALEQRSFRAATDGVYAMVTGFLLAAFFILPAWYEQRWVNIKEVLSSGLRPEQNFLFTSINDPEHNLFNLIVSTVATATIVITGAAAVAAHHSPAPRLIRLRGVWWALAALGAASTTLMFHPTWLAWRYLPELRYVQFPWRWLLPLGVVFAGLAALAIRETRAPLVWTALLAALLVAMGGYLVNVTWWDWEDIPVIRAAIVEGKGYEGTDEYETAGADRYDLPENAPRVAVHSVATTAESPRPSRVHIERWGAEEKLFTVDAPQPATAALRLMNYPAWRVEINGRVAPAESHSDSGQMLIPLPAGSSRVRVHFAPTWDRLAGALISMMAGASLLVLTLKRRRVSLAP